MTWTSSQKQNKNARTLIPRRIPRNSGVANWGEKNGLRTRVPPVLLHVKKASDLVHLCGSCAYFLFKPHGRRPGKTNPGESPGLPDYIPPVVYVCRENRSEPFLFIKSTRSLNRYLAYVCFRSRTLAKRLSTVTGCNFQEAACAFNVDCRIPHLKFAFMQIVIQKYVFPRRSILNFLRRNTLYAIFLITISFFEESNFNFRILSYVIHK